MSTPLRNEYFGPYKLIRAIGSAHGASRFVVLCSRTDTNYMLYRFGQMNNHKHRRRLFDALIKMSSLDHPHLLKVQSVSYDDQGRLCVITPYTGNHDGLVSLDDLLQVRDGKLGMVEAVRALEHLLDAISYAHKHEVINGAISPSDVLVDRYGCLQIQFYGFESLVSNTDQQVLPRSIKVVDETRSVVDLGYTAMTGLSSRGDRIAPSRVIKKIDRNWDLWFDIGLDPIDGFESLSHAINALPTNPRCSEWLTTKSSRIPQVQLGSMLRRFRSAPAATNRQSKDS
jgi:serine/threonine protein kinase